MTLYLNKQPDMLNAIPEIQREPIKAFLFSYHLQTCKEAISLKSFITNAFKAWQQNKFGMKEIFNCNDCTNELVEKSIYQAFEASKLKYNLVSKRDEHEKHTSQKASYRNLIHSPEKEESRKSYLTPTLSFLQRAIDKCKIPNYVEPDSNIAATFNANEREQSRTIQRSKGEEFTYAARNYKSHIRLYKEPAQGDENNLLSNRCSSLLQSSNDSPRCGNQTTMLSTFFHKPCRRRSNDGPSYSEIKTSKEERYNKANKLLKESMANSKLAATQAIPNTSRSGKISIEKPQQVITKEGIKIPFLKNLKVHSSMKNIKDDRKKGYSSKLKDHCWKSAKMFETKRPTEVNMVMSNEKNLLIKNAANKAKVSLIPKIGNSKSQAKNYATEQDTKPTQKHYLYRGLNIDSNLESIFNKMNYAQLASVKKTHLLYATHINQLKK